MKNQVVLSAIIAEGIPDEPVRRYFADSYLPGFPAEGALSETAGYLHQLFTLGNYLVHHLVSYGDYPSFSLIGDHSQEWAVLALRGSWGVQATENTTLVKGQMAGIFAQQIHLSFEKTEELQSLVIVEPISHLRFKESHSLPTAALLKHIPESVFRIIKSTHFPAPIPLHTDMLGVLITALLTNPETAYRRVGTSDLDIAREVKHFLDQHVYSPISAATLATEFGLSVSRLIKAFRELYACSPYEYIRNRKLEISKAQLETTNRTLKQISKEAGYRDTSNFSIAFKKKFGITPGAARSEE